MSIKIQEAKEGAPFWIDQATSDEGLPEAQEGGNQQSEKKEEAGGKKKKCEESNSSTGKGEKSKKKREKKATCEPIQCPTSPSTDDGVADLSPTPELNTQCHKYEILRRNYELLRHHYVHLRRRYELDGKNVQKLIEKSSRCRREKRGITDEEGLREAEKGGGGGGKVKREKTKEAANGAEENWAMFLLKL